MCNAYNPLQYSVLTMPAFFGMDVVLLGLNKNLFNMKKTILILTAVTGAFAFTACNNNSEKDLAKQDAENLTKYVDSVESATPIYTTANWTEIDNGYQERALKAEAKLDQLEAADKEKAEQAKAKYATLKATYETKIKEKEAAAATPDYRLVLRNRLFGEGKIGADMKFDYVTAANILDVYKNFVNNVEANRNEFTREDWDEIKVLYEALDSRKNAVEKDLSTGDNLKIAQLKIKFAAIKAVKRPVAKAAENVESKQ